MIDIHNINGYGIEDPGFALLREVAQKYCPEEFQEQRKELFPDEPLNLAAIDKGEDFGIGIPETQKLRDLHYEEADTLNSEQIKKDFPVTRFQTTIVRTIRTSIVVPTRWRPVRQMPTRRHAKKCSGSSMPLPARKSSSCAAPLRASTSWHRHTVGSS